MVTTIRVASSEISGLKFPEIYLFGNSTATFQITVQLITFSLVLVF